MVPRFTIAGANYKTVCHMFVECARRCLGMSCAFLAASRKCGVSNARKALGIKCRSWLASETFWLQLQVRTSSAHSRKDAMPLRCRGRSGNACCFGPSGGAAQRKRDEARRSNEVSISKCRWFEPYARKAGCWLCDAHRLQTIIEQRGSAKWIAKARLQVGRILVAARFSF